MAILKTILKQNGNTVLPKAQLNGIDLTNVIASFSGRSLASYTSVEDCFLVSSVKATGNFDYFVKIDNVTIWQVSGSNYNAQPIPIKKGQVITVRQNEGEFDMKYYGIK